MVTVAVRMDFNLTDLGILHEHGLVTFLGGSWRHDPGVHRWSLSFSILGLFVTQLPGPQDLSNSARQYPSTRKSLH